MDASMRVFVLWHYGGMGVYEVCFSFLLGFFFVFFLHEVVSLYKVSPVPSPTYLCAFICGGLARVVKYIPLVHN